jgi:hypothetical protein
LEARRRVAPGELPQCQDINHGGNGVNKFGLAVGLMVIGVVLVLFAVFQHFAQARSPLQVPHGAIYFSVLGVLALAGGVATYLMKGKATDASPTTNWSDRNPSDTLP